MSSRVTLRVREIEYTEKKKLKIFLRNGGHLFNKIP